MSLFIHPPYPKPTATPKPPRTRLQAVRDFARITAEYAVRLLLCHLCGKHARITRHDGERYVDCCRRCPRRWPEGER